MSLTDLRRGEGWRELSNRIAGDLPAVVRYLRVEEDGGPAELLGSGSIIGNVEGRWLITATAAQVIDGLRLSVGGAAGAERRYGTQTLQALRCAVTIPERGGELVCRVAAAVAGPRDTALVFLPLPEPTPTLVLPVDLGPPPAPEEALLVAGFTAAGAAQGADARGPAAFPERRLLVREGFFADFGSTSRLHPYPLFRHLVPLEPGMIGGPVIVHREQQPGQSLRTLVAINNLDVPMITGVAAQHPEKEGEGLATHVLSLYAHSVALPNGSWVPFIEAVRRGVVASFGPEATRVALGSGPNGAPRYFIEAAGS
jgi:hypothetical protein